MMITHLKSTNWKNYKTVDVDLGKRVFIVGPNASGKLNLLDALRFLRDVAMPTGGGLQQAIGDRGGGEPEAEGSNRADCARSR
jgi:predicted ATPase